MFNILTMREMQIKTTRYTHVKITITKNWSEDIEKQNSHTLLVKMEMSIIIAEKYRNYSKFKLPSPSSPGLY